MTLNRKDYPELTDEQWDAIQADYQAEADRRATDASETARKNARRGYIAEADVDARINTALEAERERAEMDATQRLEADRKALDDERQSVAADRRAVKVERALTDAGLPAEKVATLIPLFANADDAKVDSAVEGFVSLYQDEVKTKVDAERQALMDAAKPAHGSTVAPVGIDAKVAERIAAGDEVGALDLQLAQAGYAPPSD